MVENAIKLSKIEVPPDSPGIDWWGSFGVRTNREGSENMLDNRNFEVPPDSPGIDWWGPFIIEKNQDDLG